MVFRVAMRPGKRRALPDTPVGRLRDQIEVAKTHIGSKTQLRFPGGQAAVQLSEDRAERTLEEPIKERRAGSTVEAVKGSTSVTQNSMVNTWQPQTARSGLEN